MKKYITIGAMWALAASTSAATYMRVNKTDGGVDQFDVEHVEEVYFEDAGDAGQDVTVSGNVGNYAYVDLGLESGLKWATYNVGATKPTETGDYFAWGETAPKADYRWTTYKYSNGTQSTMLKYCTSATYGLLDNKTVLDGSDDAATVNWKSEWRMPTSDEQRELLEACSWKWTDNFNGSGVAGTVGTSKANGNTIFFPASGYYDGKKLIPDASHAVWSSSVNSEFTYLADLFFFGSDGSSIARSHRMYGRTVRAVAGKRKEPKVEVTVSGKVGKYDYVDLGLPSGLMWATCNVGADKPTEYGAYFAWGETSPKSTYSESTYKWSTADENGWIVDLLKYNVNSDYGMKDYKTQLDAEDDAATANWGKDWRMPTVNELKELLDGCTWKWTDSFNGSGVAGKVGTSKYNGSIIFLPAAGTSYDDFPNSYVGSSGYYWSSNINDQSQYAHDLYIIKENINCFYSNRYQGQSVRAVSE